MTTQTIELAAAPHRRALRLAPGLIFLLIIILVAGYSIAVQFPRRVVPANAPAADFSAERAMVHLPAIASQPHPAGSAAQAQVREYLVTQLKDLGLQPELQPFGRAAQNVIARLPGSDSSGAIVVLTHYDSVPAGPGAADNGAGVAALLEATRALLAGPRLRNDVIILFDDAEEGGPAGPPFAGSRAFAQDHPWMADVRLAMSLDTAVAGAPLVNEAGNPNGRVVQALAAVHRSAWPWTSAAGGGTYDSSPFKARGVIALDLEDNYAFRVQHTRADVPGIVRPASVQQLGDQALAITRQLGGMDLTQPWGVQETYFYVPLLGLVHYPQSWNLPLAILSLIVLLAAMVLALRRPVATGRGLLVGLAAVIAAALLSAVVVSFLWSKLPGLLGWKTSAWPEWPEIVPPGGGWILVGAMGLSLAIAAGLYILARRWSHRTGLALAALAPMAVIAVGIPMADPRLSFLPLWPALIGSLAWLAFLGISRLRQVSLDWPAWIAAWVAVIHFPGILMVSFLDSGPSDLGILAVFWVMVAFIVMPAVEGAVASMRGEALVGRQAI